MHNKFYVFLILLVLSACSSGESSPSMLPEPQINSNTSPTITFDTEPEPELISPESNSTTAQVLNLNDLDLSAGLNEAGVINENMKTSHSVVHGSVYLLNNLENLYLVDINNGRILASKQVENIGERTSFLPDGFAHYTEDAIIVYDWELNQKAVFAHETNLKCAFSPSGSAIACEGDYSQIKIIDPVTTSTLKTIDLSTGFGSEKYMRIESIGFTSDESLLFLGGYLCGPIGTGCEPAYGGVDLSNDNVLFIHSQPSIAVSNLQISENYLLIPKQSRTKGEEAILLYDIPDRQEKMIPLSHSNEWLSESNTARISPTGKYFLTSVWEFISDEIGYSETIRVYNLESTEIIREIRLETVGSPVIADFTEDENAIVVAYMERPSNSSVRLLRFAIP